MQQFITFAQQPDVFGSLLVQIRIVLYLGTKYWRAHSSHQELGPINPAVVFLLKKEEKLFF